MFKNEFEVKINEFEVKINEFAFCLTLSGELFIAFPGTARFAFHRFRDRIKVKMYNFFVS